MVRCAVGVSFRFVCLIPNSYMTRFRPCSLKKGPIAGQAAQEKEEKEEKGEIVEAIGVTRFVVTIAGLLLIVSCDDPSFSTSAAEAVAAWFWPGFRGIHILRLID